jgi:hypothetical protein
MVRVMIQRNTSSVSHPEKQRFSMKLPVPITSKAQVVWGRGGCFRQDQKHHRINQISSSNAAQMDMEGTTPSELHSHFSVDSAILSKDRFKSLYTEFPF